MTNEQAKSLMDSTRQHFKELGWPDSEVEAAMTYLNMSTAILLTSGMSLGNVKFPEILRAMANMIEIKIKEDMND